MYWIDLYNEMIKFTTSIMSYPVYKSLIEQNKLDQIENGIYYIEATASYFVQILDGNEIYPSPLEYEIRNQWDNREKIMISTFENELKKLINKHSQENHSNTPDFILAMYLQNCLSAFNMAVQQRETWYGRDGRPSIKNDMDQLKNE